jgi:ribosomal protein S3AE
MISNIMSLNGKIFIVTTEIQEKFIYSVRCKTDEVEITSFITEISEEKAKNSVYEKYKDRYPVNKLNMRATRLYRSEFEIGQILMEGFEF